MNKLRWIRKPLILFYFGIITLISQRFFHLGNVIEEPMSWRQFDTEYYAYDFYLNGIDLMHPSVCWMGPRKTLILEFPLVSAIIAFFYNLFEPSVFYARVVVFLLFLGSAYFLFKIINYLYYPRLAKLTVLTYLMLPLSLYYSRAVHIDFGAMFFTLGMLYYFIVGYNKSKLVYIILGSSLGCVALLIKAPYVFYLFIPILYYVIRENKFNLFLKTLPITVFPVIIFIIWQSYAIKINSSAQDWFFIPGYFKFTNMTEWYSGYLDQRFNLENWKTLLYRFIESETSYLGISFFTGGLFLKTENGFNKKFFYFYSIGLILYLLIFFSLNLIHDYYQIPILVISSFFIAVSLDYIYRKLRETFLPKAIIITTIIVTVLMVNCIWFTERWYYKIDRIRLEASEKIRDNTNGNDLIIASIKDTDPRDPRLLAPSHRNGWSIKISDLNKDLIENLIQNGANYLVIVSEEKINQDLYTYLKKYTKKVFNKTLNQNWKIELYKLR